MSKHLLGNMLAIQPEELCSAYAARAARCLVAAGQIGQAQIAALFRCSDLPLFGTELEQLHAIIGSPLVPPPFQLAYQHSFLPMAMAFEEPHVGQLFLRDMLKGPGSRAVKLQRANLHSFCINPGVCLSCLQEQIEHVGIGIWLRSGMLKGWEMCLAHHEPIRRMCAACSEACRHRGLPPAPTEVCQCGKSLQVDKRVLTHEREWYEIAQDFQALLRVDPERVNGPTLQVLVREQGLILSANQAMPGDLLHGGESGPDLSPGNALRMRGAGETSAARVAYGHGFSGSPIVNVVALRRMFGSVRAAIALLGQADQKVTGAASTGVGQPFLQVDRKPDVARLELDQTMVMALKKRLPHLRLSDLELAWRDELTYVDLHAPRWLRDQFACAERLQERWQATDEAWAQQVRRKAKAMRQDLHAPWITVKRLLDGVVRYATYQTQRGRLPKLVAALATEAETGEEWERRHLYIKLIDYAHLATGALDLSRSEIAALTREQVKSKLVYIDRKIREDGKT